MSIIIEFNGSAVNTAGMILLTPAATAGNGVNRVEIGAVIAGVALRAGTLRL